MKMIQNGGWNRTNYYLGITNEAINNVFDVSFPCNILVYVLNIIHTFHSRNLYTREKGIQEWMKTHKLTPRLFKTIPGKTLDREIVFSFFKHVFGGNFP